MAKIDDLLRKMQDMWDSNGFTNRRTRMEEDYRLYTLEPYDAGDGYQSYTSNAPKVTADKIISWMNDSRMIVTTPFGQRLDTRDSGDSKEKYIVGAMNMADSRLIARGMLPSKNQLAAHIVLRGWFAGRAVLNKRKDKTYVDITPFDPLRVVFEQDDDGIIWLAYRTLRSSQTIKQLYNVDVPEPTNSEYDDEFGVAVWDYYDREQHAIVIDGQAPRWGKKPLPHGVTNTEGEGVAPVFVGPVGITPWIQGVYGDADKTSDYGESVFSANRNLFEEYNFVMSATKTLVRRGVRQPYVIESPDGTQTLDTDPWQDGTEVPLPAGTQIKPMPEIKMPTDTPAFQALVSGEIQRGGLSNVHMGELPFAISGYAANVVREGSAHQLEPRLKALSSAFTQIGELLAMQYISNKFGKLKLSGRLNDLTDQFDEEIDPEQVEDGGRVEVEFKPNSGLEDPQRIATAQMLREGENPLAPDDWIWENVLEVSDTEQFKTAISAQKANLGDPKVQLMNMITALLKSGEDNKAMIYIDLLMKTVEQERMTEQMQAAQFQAAQLQASLPPQMGGGQPAQPASLGVQAGAIPQAQFTGSSGVPQQAAPGEAGGPSIEAVLNAIGLSEG
tara:strand:+ start:2365 stop:4209 length:1845 start_codon:yes stop_codon:yes gene_type:complete